MFQPNHVYTLEEYWRLVEQDPNHKYEYVDGHVRMMAGGTVPHGEIGVNICFSLKAALRGMECDTYGSDVAHGQLGGRIGSLLDRALINSECRVYNSDVAVLFANERLYYPDTSVSCDPHDWKRKNAIEAPTIIAEVLSPTTRQIDLNEKLSFYQNYPTIQDILYVESQKKSVTHHYRRLPSSKWETHHFTHDDDVIELASIEVTFTVRDIYRKVYLELEE